jgi:LysR family transcriptional regulator, transcriptional activator of nhaA
MTSMAWLNYHHLFYFWTVAREGTIARAAIELRLTEPTVGEQLRELERSIGEKLFVREGRKLVLTEMGRVAYSYANDIFMLGREFQAAMSGAKVGKSARLLVGVADVVPRLIAFRLLEPAVRSPDPVTIVCQNEPSERLLARLAAHELDVVISDAPPAPGAKLKTTNRLLGECGVTIFGAEPLWAKYRRGFPTSLDGAPFLLPMAGATLRRSVDDWLDAIGVRPSVRGEFSDSALLKAFGGAGIGVFAAPSAIERDIKHEYRVRVIGRVDSLRERFFVISANRRVQHPAVTLISNSARTRLFG